MPQDDSLAARLLGRAITGGLALGAGSLLPKGQQEGYSEEYINTARQMEAQREQRRQRRAQFAMQLIQGNQQALGNMSPEERATIMEPISELTQLPQDQLSQLLTQQPTLPAGALPGILQSFPEGQRGAAFEALAPRVPALQGVELPQMDMATAPITDEMLLKYADDFGAGNAAEFAKLRSEGVPPWEAAKVLQPKEGTTKEKTRKQQVIESGWAKVDVGDMPDDFEWAVMMEDMGVENPLLTPSNIFTAVQKEKQMAAMLAPWDAELAAKMDATAKERTYANIKEVDQFLKGNMERGILPTPDDVQNALMATVVRNAQKLGKGAPEGIANKPPEEATPDVAKTELRRLKALGLSHDEALAAMQKAGWDVK